MAWKKIVSLILERFFHVLPKNSPGTNNFDIFQNKFLIFRRKIAQKIFLAIYWHDFSIKKFTILKEAKNMRKFRRTVPLLCLYEPKNVGTNAYECIVFYGF